MPLLSVRNLKQHWSLGPVVVVAGFSGLSYMAYKSLMKSDVSYGPTPRREQHPLHKDLHTDHVKMMQHEQLKVDPEFDILNHTISDFTADMTE